MHMCALRFWVRMARIFLPSDPPSWLKESLLFKTRLLKSLKLLHLPGMAVDIWNNSWSPRHCVSRNVLDINMGAATKLRLWCLAVFHLAIQDIS